MDIEVAQSECEAKGLSSTSVYAEQSHYAYYVLKVVCLYGLGRCMAWGLWVVAERERKKEPLFSATPPKR